jgi:hypothetical protein
LGLVRVPVARIFGRKTGVGLREGVGDCGGVVRVVRIRGDLDGEGIRVDVDGHE